MPQQPSGWTLVQPAAPGWTPVTQPESAPSSALDAAKRFVVGFAHNVDPRPALKLVYDGVNGMGGMLTGDTSRAQAFADDLKGLGQNQLEQFKKGYDAYKAGRYSEAAGHTLAGALPLVGPAAAESGEQIGRGDVAGGLGAGAALIAPAALHALPTEIRPRIPTPQVSEAVRFGQSRGIPIDAATATDSGIVRSVQKKVSDSMGGAGTAERFKTEQASRLATVGEQLAAKANEAPQVGPLQPGASRPMAPGAPVTPEQAGALAQNTVRDVVHDRNAAATTSYEKLRQIETQPQRQRTVTMAGPEGDAQVSMALPVDLRATKSALTDAYMRLKQEGDVAPLMGGKAEAARILNRIVMGPDYAPLSVVDGALGELKTFTRADNPDLRSAGQGVVAQAVTKLDADVRAAAAQAGPEAVKALEDGRKATTAKYVAADVLKGLERGAGEPVAAYNRLTARGDSAIGQLRDLAQQAPDVLPQIGRAVLDGFMETATADGGFEHARALRSKWDKLGPQTKVMLFREPGYIADIDNFFRLADKIAENPNPSGTARINNLFNATSAAVGYPIAKLLYSDAGVKLLTEGLRVPLQSPTLVASYTARLTAALKAQAALQPAMAGDTQEQTPTTIGRR